MKTLSLQQFYTDITTLLADIIFPMHCFGCKTEGTFLCLSCAKGLKLASQQCVMCLKPSLDGITHARCSTAYGPDRLISLYDYHDPVVAEMLVLGKYKFLPDVYKILGALLTEQLAQYSYLLYDSHLAPLPLSKQRERWRGFNQSKLLCSVIGDKLTIPVIEPLLRTKHTKVQKDLGLNARLENMKNAFAFDTSFDVHGKNILLIDDVITTGTSLREAVKVLKRWGAGQVFCLTVARD